VTADAIETLRTMFAETSLPVELTLRSGEIQIVNNLEIGHMRTAFEDFPEAARKRRLVRLWLARPGQAELSGLTQIGAPAWDARAWNDRAWDSRHRPQPANLRP